MQCQVITVLMAVLLPLVSSASRVLRVPAVRSLLCHVRRWLGSTAPQVLPAQLEYSAQSFTIVWGAEPTLCRAAWSLGYSVPQEGPILPGSCVPVAFIVLAGLQDQLYVVV